MEIQFAQHHLLKRLSCPHSMALTPLSPSSEVTPPHEQGFISGLSALSPWSVCLSFHQDHTVLITVTFEIRKRESPAVFSSFQDSSGDVGSLRFQVDFRMGFSTSGKKKWHWDYRSNCTEPGDHFGWHRYLCNIKSSDHEHGMCSHLLMLPVINFGNVYSFQCVSLSSLWLIPKHFVWFWCYYTWNHFCMFLFRLSVASVEKCVLTCYLATFPNSFISSKRFYFCSIIRCFYM